jgi:hypothetical protein
MIMPAVLGNERCLVPGTLRIAIVLAVAFNATAFAQDSQKRETTSTANASRAMPSIEA